MSALPRVRTTGTARIREVWDCRLRVSERELILERAGLASARVTLLAECTWSTLSPEECTRVLLVLRDFVQLGNEAAYALGYSRRNA